MVSIFQVVVLITAICILEIEGVPKWAKSLEKFFGKTHNARGRNNNENSEVGLDWTNFIRKDHNTPFLKLNPELEAAAQRTAEALVAAGDFADVLINPEARSEGDNSNYSQNVYNFSDNWLSMRPRMAILYSIAGFYDPVNEYDYAAPVASSFTRLIWKSSTDFGIGIAMNGNQTVVVANYAPPSPDVVTPDNVKLFYENVLPEGKVVKAE